MEKETERIYIGIPGTETVGGFNIKAFQEALYGPHTKRYGVRARAHVFRDDIVPVVCAKEQPVSASCKAESRG